MLSVEDVKSGQNDLAGMLLYITPLQLKPSATHMLR